ncbi:MAG: (Fe-S)-binding protein [Thermodesulfobacteriota bacterium]|nr:(Fe-S)-binding protein [Thermodesulfobacteriota bacterium]
MLLKSYRKEIFRPECNPGFQSLHCIAHLDQDISDSLPYLNATLGGFTYINDPLSVTFKCHGKLISVYPRKIAVNALRDDTEAEKILQWLKNEINDAWKRRNDITPSYKSVPRPNMLEILKILPRTNCQECGHPTCLVFSTLVAEGARGPDDCPPLDRQGKEKLEEYLGQFIFNL